MSERGAHIARLMTTLAFGSVGVVAAAFLLAAMYPQVTIGNYLGSPMLVLATLAPLLALSSVITGLAAGIGFPMKSAVALILSIVVSVLPLLNFLWNCPEGGC